MKLIVILLSYALTPMTASAYDFCDGPRRLERPASWCAAGNIGIRNQYNQMREQAEKDERLKNELLFLEQQRLRWKELNLINEQGRHR